MSKLDNEKNWNLFKLVNFLNLYYSSNNASFQKEYQNIMNTYGDLIKKIKQEGKGYKSNVEKNLGVINPFNPEHIDKIPNHIQMIDNFDNLPDYEKKNVMFLTWYILYCQINKLDVNNPKQSYPLWKRYSELIKQINSLFNNQ